MFRPSMGMERHGKSGHTVNDKHFTGPKAGKRVRRIGKGLTRKERKIKRGKHKNKYSPD